MWFALALISAVADGSKNLFQKAVMRTQAPWPTALLENIISVLLFVPAAIINWELPGGWLPWALLFSAGTIWAGIAGIGYLTLKHTQVTLRNPLSQTRLVFALVLGVLFLHESLTWSKAAGTALILGGAIVLSYHKRRLFGRLTDPGVQLTLLGAFLGALVAIIDKAALQHFNPSVYGAFVYTIPTIILACIVLPKVKGKLEFSLAWREHKWFIMIIAFLAAFAYYLALQAYDRAEATQVYPVLRLSMVVSMLGSAALFQDEREDLARRLVGAAIVTIGAFFIAGVF